MAIKTQYGISFHARIGYDIEFDVAGKGLGFYGPGGSGSNVEIDEWNKSTYIVEGDPWNPMAQVETVSYDTPHSGLIAGETSIHLHKIPSYQSTLNIRFTQDHPVKVVNAKCNLYDGVTLANPPYGWSVRLAEIIHPSRLQTNTGKGDSPWHVASTGQSIDLVDNPGISGSYAGMYSPSGHYRHDWYLAISASPEQVGSKTAGLYVYLEYL